MTQKKVFISIKLYLILYYKIEIKSISKRLKKQNSLKNFIETILMTDTIIKINRFNMSQSRYIMITDKAVYNYQKKSIFLNFNSENNILRMQKKN